MANGTYHARFANSGCGTMVITGSGASISYSFGPCGDSPTFRSKGSFDGKIIQIGQATYTLSNTSSNALTGQWKLGNYITNVTFRK